MKHRLLIALLCIMFLSAGAAVAQAAEVFGFNLGVQTLDQVKASFKKDKVKFVEYSVDSIPVMRINKYARFEKYGTLLVSRFAFMPNSNKLYTFSIEYKENEKTLNIFKDTLDSKFSFFSKDRIGLETTYQYLDDGKRMRIFLIHRKQHVVPGKITIGFEDLALRAKIKEYEKKKAEAEKEANIRKTDGDM